MLSLIVAYNRICMLRISRDITSIRKLLEVTSLSLQNHLTNQIACDNLKFFFEKSFFQSHFNSKGFTD